MADTVKKSRIVSDEDNLEESLLEEFNMRLKNCMSEDDLQKEPPDENYHKPQITQMFLQQEIHHYDEPRSLKNGHQEELYEVIPEKTESDQKYVPMDLNLYESVQPPTLNLPVEDKSPDIEPISSVKNRMLLSCDETSTLLFTQTVTSPMLTPSEENIDFLKGFQKVDGNSPEENFYENAEFYKNTTPENTYENIVLGRKEEEEDEKEDIYENVEICKDESLEEFIRHEAEAGKEDIDNVTAEDEAASVEIISDINAAVKAADNFVNETIEEDACKASEEDQFPLNNATDAAVSFNETVDEDTCEDELDCTPVVENGHELKLETYKELIHHHRSEVTSNYYEKYTETLSKKTDLLSNKEKDTETVPAEIVKNLKSQFQNGKVEVVGIIKKNPEPKSVIINQIRTKFETNDDSTEYTETIVETSGAGEKSIKKKKVKKTRKEEKENISVKSSFSKFDALQKKNVLHVRSSDSTKAQEKFSNGNAIEQASNCKSCGKQVFQMEQIKAERALWHKNCFRCIECSKQLTVDTYESNDGSLYCKPHFKALFAPKAVEEDAAPKSRRNELIIHESQPVELPPDVVRASDKPDLGLEELQSLNVKERFQVFEQFQQHIETSEMERGGVQNVKRSPSILSKLAKFQKHGMDIGVSNEALDGIPIEESESEEEEEEEIPEGEDADLVRAKRVQKEKPFHFTGMSDVKKRWEQGDHAREERREETKQEIQNIRTKLFMGKQEKMKEAYQQAVMVSESSSNLRKNLSDEIDCDTRSIKERFEKGEVANEKVDRERSNEEEEVYESEISKKSRSLFLELDASASKPPQLSPVTPPKLEVKKAREAYLEKTSKEDTVKSTEQVDEVEVKTADIQERFKFFETYKEPEKQKKQFRITPPRDASQVKSETPEREIQRDPDVIRSEEYIDDSTIAKESHTASKMLNKFRQMEENMSREPELQGPKPLKRFTPPPEPARPESRSEEESEYEEEEEEEEEEIESGGKLPDDVIEAQKAARAKQLRAKFEKWEANEIKKEQQNAVSVVQEFGEEQTQTESTRVLRARFEQMRETTSETTQKTTRVRPNRFVEIPAAIMESCQSCSERVYPLEKITVHGHIYHKGCFKCMECSCVLRMDTYCYNQGLLYCTPHFKRVFISKGNYDSAFGLDQHKEKWQNGVNNMTVA